MEESQASHLSALPFFCRSEGSQALPEHGVGSLSVLSTASVMGLAHTVHPNIGFSTGLLGSQKQPQVHAERCSENHDLADNATRDQQVFYAITSLNYQTSSSTIQPHHQAYDYSYSTLYHYTSDDVSLPTIHSGIRSYLPSLRRVS